MTGENISWSITTKEWCLTLQVSNLQPSDHQSNAHLTEPPRLAYAKYSGILALKFWTSSFTTCWPRVYTVCLSKSVWILWFIIVLYVQLNLQVWEPAQLKKPKNISVIWPDTRLAFSTQALRMMPLSTWHSVRKNARREKNGCQTGWKREKEGQKWDSQRWVKGQTFSVSDLDHEVPFQSCRRWNIVYDCTALHYTEPFIITLLKLTSVTRVHIWLVIRGLRVWPWLGRQHSFVVIDH